MNLHFIFALVDIFFMKTCHFRGASPRLVGENNDEPEGIICQLKPIAQYGMVSCYDRHCFLCGNRREYDGELINTAVHYSSNRVHRFVNKYEAILNCHVVSLSKHTLSINSDLFVSI